MRPRRTRLVDPWSDQVEEASRHRALLLAQFSSGRRPEAIVNWSPPSIGGSLFFARISFGVLISVSTIIFMTLARPRLSVRSNLQH